MTVEELRQIMTKHNISLQALSHLSGLPAPHLSTWFRGLDTPTDTMRDRVYLTIQAMVRLEKKSGLPIRWSQPVQIRAALENEIIELRAERSAELRRQFEKSLVADAPGPDICELLGLDDSNCNCG